jgi:arylsulfatase
MTRRHFHALLPAALASARAADPPPNIVLLLADDLGYGDLGCYGNRSIRTPNIDLLASQGARLTEFYSSPTCTPSRAALLTGRYPLRSGLTRVLIPREHFGIRETELTLAEVLQQRGYRTGCIGKWHLGDRLRHRPTRHGFDRFFGVLYSHDMFLPVVHWPPVRLFSGEKPLGEVKTADLTQHFTEEAIRFLDEAAGGPFFLYLPYTAPHAPLAVTRDFAGKSAHGLYGDTVEELDWSVGRVLGKLKQRGLAENTIVIFASDNGPARVPSKPSGDTGGLRGGKGSAWEGGVRVPFIVRWPGRAPEGTVRSGITSALDLFPTLARAAGAQVPTDHILDGLDLTGFLTGDVPSPRTRICHFRRGEVLAIRAGSWKLHLRRGPEGQQPRLLPRPELYDLDTDAAEARDLAADHPDVVANLEGLSVSIRNSIEAGRVAPSHLRSLLPGKKSGRVVKPGKNR